MVNASGINGKYRFRATAGSHPLPYRQMTQEKKKRCTLVANLTQPCDRYVFKYVLGQTKDQAYAWD